MQVQLITSHGDIVLQLYPDKAPVTVQNFIAYVRDGHYDGTIFHRVISDFMIQAGGMDERMQEKSTRGNIKNEAENGLSNLLGTVAMARKNEPHSACAQFFINTNDNPFLDFQAANGKEWGYCVFGEVIEGMDVVEKIEETPTTSRNGHQDVPEELVVITKATVIKTS